MLRLSFSQNSCGAVNLSLRLAELVTIITNYYEHKRFPSQQIQFWLVFSFQLLPFKSLRKCMIVSDLGKMLFENSFKESKICLAKDTQIRTQHYPKTAPLLLCPKRTILARVVTGGSKGRNKLSDYCTRIMISGKCKEASAAGSRVPTGCFFYID